MSRVEEANDFREAVGTGSSGVGWINVGGKKYFYFKSENDSMVYRSLQNCRVGRRYSRVKPMKLQAYFPVLSMEAMSFPCTICKKETEEAYRLIKHGQYLGRWPCCKEHSEDELYNLINPEK